MISENTSWRILHTEPARGAWNMAVDEAILESVRNKIAPPTLRLYQWDPACLSLGYGQSYSDVNEAKLEFYRWDVVRRPTGGRAILHVDELTYSICAPGDHPLMKGGIMPSYKEISMALMRSLEILAVPAKHEEKYDLPVDADPKGPVCFEVPSNWEITFEGKKLVGSAQVRRSGGVLQHGTLPLHGDLGRISHGLNFENEESRKEASERLLSRAVTVENAIGRIVTWKEAAKAIKEGFSESLQASFTKSEMLPEELSRANALHNEKYNHASWTKRR